MSFRHRRRDPRHRRARGASRGATRRPGEARGRGNRRRSAAHARRPPGLAGELELRHPDAARAAHRPRGKRTPHQGGSRGVRETCCRKKRRRSAHARHGRRRGARVQRFLVRPRHENCRYDADVADCRSQGRPAAGPYVPRAAGRRRARRDPPAQHRGSRRAIARGALPAVQRGPAASAGSLQQQSADRTDQRLRRDCQRDDSRHARRAARRPAPPAVERPPLAGRSARPLGRRHARRRFDELLRQDGGSRDR